MIRALLPLLLLPACTGGETEGVPRTLIDSSGDVGPVVVGTNAFTFDVYGEAVEGTDANTFVSPFSLSAALSMTMAGASGDTLAEMQQVLGADDPATWHSGFGSLIRDLDGDFGRSYQLEIANRLFGAPDYPWSEAFLGICSDDYGAPLEPTDFASDPEAGRKRVNDWVAEQTNDRILDLMPPGSVSASTVLVLANAIYFLADWATPFDPEDTNESGTFTRLDGTTVTAPIMRLETKELKDDGLSLGFIDGGTVVRLPYGGDEVSMVLVVPDAVDGLPALEQGLTDAVFDDWLTTLGSPGADVSLMMPRFEMEYTLDAIPLLTELGMGSLFASADLSAMTDPPGNGLFVSGVFHKAFVKVDEKGTEAAAASAVAVDESAPPFIDATHPFLFAILDDLTGTALFVGRVMDPAAG